MNASPASTAPATGDSGAAAPSPGLREIATDAMRYWEPRRVLYNAMLAVIVACYYWSNWDDARTIPPFDLVRGLFILAVLANICYCAAYVVDVFAQLSGFRDAWRRGRWVLLAIGLVFAAILTQFMSKALFEFGPVTGG